MIDVRRERALTAVLAVLLVAAPVLVATATASPAPAGEAPAALGADRAADAGNYSLEELQGGGEVVDERYPSLRVASETVAFWIVRYPPSGFNSYGGENAQEEYLEPTTTVRRNRVRMFATHPFDGEMHNYSLRLVYWHRDSREVTRQTENGTITTTEQYANVTGTASQTLSFGPGFQRHDDVHLRGHYDDGERVTAFMTVAGTTMQWTWTHKSIKTAQPINIDTRADLYGWLVWWILLPTIVLEAIVVVGVRAFRTKARAGTGHSPWYWIILGGLVMCGIYMFGYVFWASLTAAVPFVFAGFVSLTTGAFLLEADEDAVETWGFIRMDPEEHPSPLDRDQAIMTASEGELRGFEVVETEDGEKALYHRGLRAMWARFRGEYALLELRNYRAEFEMTGLIDKLVVVDPDVEEVLAHEPTEWLVRWPWRTYHIDDFHEDSTPIEVQKARLLPSALDGSAYVRSAVVLASIGLAGVVGHHILQAGGIGGVFTAGAVAGIWAWYYAAPLTGWAYTEAAEGHARAAWVTPWYITINLRRFGSLDAVVDYAETMRQQAGRMESYLQNRQTEGIIAQSFERHPMDEPLLEDDPALGEDARGAAEGTTGEAGPAATDGGDAE